jgi:hypothetical protein
VAWSFLPAKRTWLEFKTDDGRGGCLLVDTGGWARLYFVHHSHNDFAGFRIGRIALADQLVKIDPSLDWSDTEASIFKDVEVNASHRPAVLAGLLRDSSLALANPPVATLLWQAYPLLLLINTPRVVGRKTHDPHRGLARHVLANRKALGVFPLQAWTEITLTTETIDASDDERRSSGLSGMMPLHWTRAHKRRIHGVWTLISDYWAGDGSLGIKRSRYKVVPPAAGDSGEKQR